MLCFRKVIGLFAMLGIAGCFTSKSAPAGAPYESPLGWLVTAETALDLQSKGAAVLDVREASDYAAGHVQGAVHVSWLHFSQPDHPERGRLLQDEAELTSRLRAAGVSGARPVVVIGDPVNGWGEDGRVVWMLRTLGHGQTAFVDGGQLAFVQAGAPISHAPATATPGDFVLFSLAAGSPSLFGLGYGPDDIIFVSPGGAPGLFAPGGALGLAPGDDLNALDLIPVPEPSSSALLGLGGLALMLRRRR